MRGFSFLLLMSFCAAAFAEKKKSVSYQFGDLKCSQEFETAKDGHPENSKFLCLKEGKLLFSKDDYGAEVILASKDGRYILGLSNPESFPFAYWVVDQKGITRAESKNHSKILKECGQKYRESGKWLTDPTPEVDFDADDEEIDEIEVKICGGSETLEIEEGIIGPPLPRPEGRVAEESETPGPWRTKFDSKLRISGDVGIIGAGGFGTMTGVQVNYALGWCGPVVEWRTADYHYWDPADVHTSILGAGISCNFSQFGKTKKILPHGSNGRRFHD